LAHLQQRANFLARQRRFSVLEPQSLVADKGKHCSALQVQLEVWVHNKDKQQQSIAQVRRLQRQLLQVKLERLRSLT
jgi:LPS sulfotransferase NodH